MSRTLLAALLLATACHHDHDAAGPAERAGRSLDTAAQKTGHALERAGDATTRAFQGAGSKLGVRGAAPDKAAAPQGSREPKGAPSKPASGE